MLHHAWRPPPLSFSLSLSTQVVGLAISYVKKDGTSQNLELSFIVMTAFFVSIVYHHGVNILLHKTHQRNYLVAILFNFTNSYIFSAFP